MQNHTYIPSKDVFKNKQKQLQEEDEKESELSDFLYFFQVSFVIFAFSPTLKTHLNLCGLTDCPLKHKSEAKPKDLNLNFPMTSPDPCWSDFVFCDGHLWIMGCSDWLNGHLAVWSSLVIFRRTFSLVQRAWGCGGRFLIHLSEGECRAYEEWEGKIEL